MAAEIAQLCPGSSTPSFIVERQDTKTVRPCVPVLFFMLLRPLGDKYRPSFLHISSYWPTWSYFFPTTLPFSHFSSIPPLIPRINIPFILIPYRSIATNSTTARSIPFTYPSPTKTFNYTIIYLPHNTSTSIHTDTMDAAAQQGSGEILSHFVGWAYFIAWSASFYPQAILNWRRKSVQGLSMDFIYLNVLGFLCYSIFNLSFFYSADVQEEYRKRNDGQDNLVRANDVFFAVHALILSSFTLLQTLIYKVCNQMQVAPL